MNRTRSFPHRLFVAVALLLSSFTMLRAQEQLGLRLERASGLYGATLNPAQLAFMPHPWEVSIGQADAWLDNRYAFLKQTNVFDAWRNRDRVVVAGDALPDAPLQPGTLVLDFYRTGGALHVGALSRLSGPGVSFRFGENNVIGLTASLRAGFGAYRVPRALRYDRLETLPRYQSIDIRQLDAAAMAWGEVAVPYSRLIDAGGIVWAVGVTPKLLLGFDGVFARADAHFDYTRAAGDTASFGNANWHYALTTRNAQAALSGDDDVRPRVNGVGVGMDLGVITTYGGDGTGDYDWKFGAALLDLGFIRFQRDAQQHALGFELPVDVSGGQFPTDDVEAAIAEASDAFLGAPGRSLAGRSFTAGLPSALTLQLDYRVAPSLYVAGVVVQRLPFGAFAVRRPNTLAAAPRYERRWWSVTVPLVLHEYRQVRVGFAARLGYLTVGTDNLLSFTGQRQLTGTDVYIGLKINGFELHGGRGGRDGGGMSGRSRRKIRCYEF